MMRKKNASTETQNCSNCSNNCGKCGRSKSATKSNQVETSRIAGKRCHSAQSSRAKSSSTRSRSSK